jgi:hypothetical protein
MERFCLSQDVAAGYKAASLENAAQRGGGAAVQTGASASEKIPSDLANIDAVRAAAHADPTSPTGAAVRDWHETLGLLIEPSRLPAPRPPTQRRRR